jgi:hypothetical protein
MSGGWLLLVLVALGILAGLVAQFLAVGAITFLRLMKKGSKK